jgi:ribonuclease III
VISPDELEKEIEDLLTDFGPDLRRGLRYGEFRLPEHLVGDVINDALLVAADKFRRGHAISSPGPYLAAVARNAAAARLSEPARLSDASELSEPARLSELARLNEPAQLNGHADQGMSAFRTALARMDADPAAAGRIRDLATLTDDQMLLDALGVRVSSDIIERALTHRSYAYEHNGLPTNERLEFLGDSVLGLVVTDTLFRGHPDLPEGQLAKLRAAVVQMSALAEVARGLNLGAHLRLGRGEELTGGRDKPSILADTLEAVIGAVYQDRGLPEADGLVHRLFDPLIARSASLGAGLDWKTSLQELTAVRSLGVPEYVVDESGPDHQKSFTAVVKVGGMVRGAGAGRSKKAAEQQAAQTAWHALNEE